MAAFKYFIILAEMRTGSNLLEASLNALDGVSCHGELFNPHFIGKPDGQTAFGVDMALRETNPAALLTAMRAATDGIAGFRFFHDHDPRVLGIALSDPACAKIILTRNPLDAFVSRKIAAATNQWRLGDMSDRKSAKIAFSMPEFETYLSVRQAFQATVRKSLQQSGQAAFNVTYEDIQNLKVLDGLAGFLGAGSRLKSLPKGLKKQNPGHLREKVSNFEEMQDALAGFDWLDLDRAPNFEPRRGPAVPGYVAAAKTPLLYAPIVGGPVQAVTDWLEAIDGAPAVTGFTQKSLRRWLRTNPGHRSFTVLRHPAARAFEAFSRHILADGPERFAVICNLLESRYGVSLPSPDADAGAVRAAFLSFLDFLAGNLSGQTSVRIDPAWASQSAVIEGFAGFKTPDRLLREDELERDLPILAGRPVAPPPPCDMSAFAAIYDATVERAARKVYRRDYIMFGFSDWTSGGL